MLIYYFLVITHKRYSVTGNLLKRYSHKRYYVTISIAKLNLNLLNKTNSNQNEAKQCFLLKPTINRFKYIIIIKYLCYYNLKFMH